MYGIVVNDWINNTDTNNNSITAAEYHNLMAWEHWSRHILNDVRNNLAATRGGIMMVRILQELSIDAQTQMMTFMLHWQGH